MRIKLILPFKDNFPLTIPFGAVSDDQNIKQKYLGISITLEHRWGKSLYAHLSEVKVKVGDKVKRGKVIGLSGSTGFSTGPHLHFGIKLKDADINNGYLGYSDPNPYF